MNILDKLKKQALQDTGFISEYEAYKYRSEITLNAAKEFAAKMESALSAMAELNYLLSVPKVDKSSKITLKSRPYEMLGGKRIEVVFCNETQKPLCASLVKDI